ncbi:hypothetical protein B7486_61345, partial [cyanobacterium TDX16]
MKGGGQPATTATDGHREPDEGTEPPLDGSAPTAERPEAEPEPEREPAPELEPRPEPASAIEDLR